MLEKLSKFFILYMTINHSIYALKQDFNDLRYHQRKSILFFDEITNFSIKITNKQPRSDIRFCVVFELLWHSD